MPGMKAKRGRRTGASDIVDVSLDPETKRKLEALADERHHGNVSAMITEMTADAARRAAFRRAWAWYGGPEPTDAERKAIDAELAEGWALARKHARKKPRRKSAA